MRSEHVSPGPAPVTPASPGDGRSLPHRAALDGLRGVAVLAVLGFHGGVSWLVGGYLGVEIFFVISGFLITSLLLVEFERDGRIDLRAFWARRARRLVPLLVLIVAAVVIYAAYIATATQRADATDDAVSALAWVTNWHEISTGTGYLAANSVPSPLLHTWSLAVEMQWYVIWPLCVVAICALLARRRHAAWIGAAVCAAGAVGATLLMARLAETGDTSRAYYGTDTRAGALLLGAALAFVVTHLDRVQPGSWRPQGSRLGRRQADRTAAGAALAASGALLGIAVAVATTSHESMWLYHGGFLLVGVATVAVLVACVHPRDNPVRRLFSLPALQWIGVLSYALYLWHWPVFLTLNSERVGVDGGPLLAVRVAVSLVLAWATMRLVEHPIRRGRIRPRAWAPVAAGVAALSVVGFVVVQDSRPTYRLPELRPVDAPAPKDAKPGDPPVVFWAGDSIAIALDWGFAEWSDETGFATHGGDPVPGCGIMEDGISTRAGVQVIVPPECTDLIARWRRAVVDQSADVVVFVPSLWDLQDRSFDGSTWFTFGDEELVDAFRRDLDEAVDALAASGAPVGIFTLPVLYNEEAHAIGPSGPIREEDPAVMRAYNDVLRDYVRTKPGTFLIDFAAEVDGTESHPGEYRGMRLFGDGVHVTEEAGRALAPWIASELEPYMAVRP